MSYWKLYYHIVWATYRREPLVTASIEPHLYKVLRTKSEEKHAEIFAINGMPDHVHLIAVVPPYVALSEFIKHLKGASSYVMNTEYDHTFKWQSGYGLFSLSKRGLDRAVQYVQRQKSHHAEGTAIPALERIE